MYFDFDLLLILSLCAAKDFIWKKYCVWFWTYRRLLLFSVQCGKNNHISVLRFEVSGWLILTYVLLRCDAVYFGRYIPEFRRNCFILVTWKYRQQVPLKSWGHQQNYMSSHSRHICLKCWYPSTKLHTAWHHTPEDPNLNISVSFTAFC
jgi:hypothetical protein